MGLLRADGEGRRVGRHEALALEEAVEGPEGQEVLELERRATPLTPEPAEIGVDLPRGDGAGIAEVPTPGKPDDPSSARA